MKHRLMRIVDDSYNILMNKLNNGMIPIDVEAGFQLQLAYILKTLGTLYEYSSDERFNIELEKKYSSINILNKSGSNKAKIDIYLSLENSIERVTCAIELKFFKKVNNREPNNRYDMFLDLLNLENYKQNGIDICYFIVATDHDHYVCKKSYSEETKDFDMRNGAKYRSGNVLQYKTNKPYGKNLILSNNYIFKWDFLTQTYKSLKINI